jgi:hypothetical protein
VPRAPSAIPSDPAGLAPTTVSAQAPTWPAGDARTLAAYCYPELRGLPPRPRDRTRQTLHLLERLPDRANEKWLERQLGRLRRDAAGRIGVDLRGEYRTPAFIDYVVEHRVLLRAALRAIEERVQTPRGTVNPPG